MRVRSPCVIRNFSLTPQRNNETKMREYILNIWRENEEEQILGNNDGFHGGKRTPNSRVRNFRTRLCPETNLVPPYSLHRSWIQNFIGPVLLEIQILGWIICYGDGVFFIFLDGVIPKRGHILQWKLEVRFVLHKPGMRLIKSNMRAGYRRAWTSLFQKFVLLFFLA